jgi:hypothetical protein
VPAFLWRLLFGVLVVRTLRLAWRWTPTLAVCALGVALWPSLAVGWVLRRYGLAWATCRWPRRARWYGRILALLGVVLGGAFGLADPALRWQLVTLYGAGWVAPLTIPFGVSPLLAGQALALGAPLWLAGGVVLGGLWPLYGGVVRRFYRRPAVGAGWGEDTGNRKSDIARRGEPVPVTLRPVPTQRIATATFVEDDWTVKPLYGPGLLAMIVAPPGVGKTEIAYGSLAAAVDGLEFCGLETHRPRRVLLLSEMEPKTIQPALQRWGFVTEASGPLHRLRLHWGRPDGSPGHLIDVVHASDAYAPGEDGRRPEWADVIRATVPTLRRGRYDLLIVDSLARWMGNDSSNAAMLGALGALRQVTRAGVGVLAPHHCAKDATPPYEPRGGSAILGELDLCWSLARLSNCTDPLHDPRRVLECVKSRFAELTPPPVRIERVGVDPAAPRPRYGYRLLEGAAVAIPDAAPEGIAALSDQQRRVLEALCAAPDHRATTPELTAATGLEANRIKECAVALIKASFAVVAGAGVAHRRGGRPPVRYAATSWALEQLPAAVHRGATPDPDSHPDSTFTTADPAVRLLHEALDREPVDDVFPPPSEGAGGRAA